MRYLSLPREHGGYITLLGSAATAMAIAPNLLPALGVSLAVAMGFLVRGPLERLAARQRLRSWDSVGLGVMVLVAGAGVVLARSAGLYHAIASAAIFAGIPLVGYVARRRRRQRHELFELAGMTFLGASVGVVAFAGGVSVDVAVVAGCVLAVHGGTSIPIVRTELRRRERERATVATVSSLLALGCTAGLVLLAGATLVVLALAPRAAHLAVRLASGPSRARPRARPVMIGLREVALLSIAALIVVLTQ